MSIAGSTPSLSAPRSAVSPHIANLDGNAFPTAFSVPVASRPASSRALMWSPSHWWYVGRVGLSVEDAFRNSVAAMDRGESLDASNPRDKEFRFQDWFESRLAEAGEALIPTGRNTYPDFSIEGALVGYEVKSVESSEQGRWKDFDANSHLPSGSRDGRTVYYVFGRYRKDAETAKIEVVDLVICHGDFSTRRTPRTRTRTCPRTAVSATSRSGTARCTLP